MSKNFKGYMGDQIGKLGTAVGRRWKRKMVYSAYQGKVKNPRTWDQRVIRARFTKLMSLEASFLPALQKGLKVLADRRQNTEGNNFVMMNWDAVTASTPEEVTVNYAALQVSSGRLPQVNFHSPDFETEGQVSVDFDAVAGVTNSGSDDKVYLFVYQPDTEQSILSMPVKRSERSITVAVPSEWSGMRVHLYGFLVGATDFESTNTFGMVSPTTYVGTGDIG